MPCCQTHLRACQSPGGGRHLDDCHEFWRSLDLQSAVRGFDPAILGGAVNFNRLVHLAEDIKSELNDNEVVDRYFPNLVQLPDGSQLSLEARLERPCFEKLIRDKVDRTIDCCHETLGSACGRTGLRMSETDYIVLVGGGTRVPLVAETVRQAF